MGHRQDISTRLLAAACGLAITAGCVSVPAGPGGEPGPRPPIVLYLDEVAVAPGGRPAAGTSSMKTAKEVFWLSITAQMTLGVPLLDLPDVIARGKADAPGSQPCADSWRAVIDEPASVLRSTDLRDFIVMTLRAELTRRVGTGAQSVPVEVGPGVGATPLRARFIRETRARLATAHLTVADVRVGVEAVSTGCTARFHARAEMRSERVDTGGADAAPGSPRPATIEESEDVDVPHWAAQPEMGRAALQKVLLRLAQGVAQTYATPTPR